MRRPLVAAVAGVALGVSLAVGVAHLALGPPSESPTEIKVAVNWFDELKARLPTK
mgnify:CR=1 FL=1